MARGARVAAGVVAVLAVIACRDARKDGDARLSFEKDGAQVKTLSLAELKDVPVETFTAYDPYYAKKKTYRALPLRAVLERAFGASSAPLEAQAYVLRAKDGYTVPLSGARLLEPGGYIAIADVDVPGWEPIGPQQVSPAPFYVVWRNDDQQNMSTHPRPWQLATIAIARFEDSFPHAVPTGEAPGSPAMRGLATFRAQCIHCHAINREGGRVGPDLNLPMNVLEYRPEAQVRAYIKNPLAFRYGNMPAHPGLTEGDLDDLVAYLRAMKDRKHEPDAGAH